MLQWTLRCMCLFQLWLSWGTCPVVGLLGHLLVLGFHSDSVVKKKIICLQFRSHRRCRFDPWVKKIPWRRAWQPTLYSCLENSWTEEPGGLQSIGSQRVGHDQSNSTQKSFISSFFKESLYYLPWLLYLSLHYNSARGFPFLHTLSSIYCM